MKIKNLRNRFITIFEYLFYSLYTCHRANVAAHGPNRPATTPSVVHARSHNGFFRRTEYSVYKKKNVFGPSLDLNFERWAIGYLHYFRRRLRVIYSTTTMTCLPHACPESIPRASLSTRRERSELRVTLESADRRWNPVGFTREIKVFETRW